MGTFGIYCPKCKWLAALHTDVDRWVPCSAELQLRSKSLIHTAENFIGPLSVSTDPKKLLEFICDPCQNRTGWDILVYSG